MNQQFGWLDPWNQDLDFLNFNEKEWEVMVFDPVAPRASRPADLGGPP